MPVGFETTSSSGASARALGSGIVAGAMAVAGLVVIHHDAHPLYDGLVRGSGRPALVASAVAGVGTLVLVWTRRVRGPPLRGGGGRGAGGARRGAGAEPPPPPGP